MKRIGTVIRFEYLGYVSAKVFRVTTIIFVAAILILCFLPQIASQFSKIDAFQGEKDKAVILLGGDALANPIYTSAFSAKTLESAVKKTTWTDGNKEDYSEEDLKKLIEGGDCLFAVYYNGGTDYSFFAAGSKISAYSALGTLDALVTESARQAAIARLPEGQRGEAAAISGMAAQVNLIEIGGNAENNFWIGYVIMFFLFYIIMGYGNYVSASVIAEKTSKAMELLITAAKPLDLMIGKVVGVGFAALTQVAAIVAAAAVGITANLTQWKAFQPTVFEMLTGANVSAALAALLLLFFFLGFFFYAFIMAALGSTVSRAEEAATTTMFPLLLLTAGLVLGFFTLSGAMNKALVSVLSYVPFFTPFVMMGRYSMGEVTVFGAAIGVIVLFAGVLVIAVLAAKIYRMGVMMYGTPATFKTVWKALIARG
ncbi:MAG: ABC transporter permease [Clostridiales Family XIII bacterium]|jgi:ABC-2 type transport system permease protein|nr:ABC transporter permease [Clostridiales Family XIII bacterium]